MRRCQGASGSKTGRMLPRAAKSATAAITPSGSSRRALPVAAAGLLAGLDSVMGTWSRMPEIDGSVHLAGFACLGCDPQENPPPS